MYNIYVQSVRYGLKLNNQFINYCFRNSAVDARQEIYHRK